VPGTIGGRQALIEDVRRAFPKGEFNCWGVPSGAKYVISNLAPGDVVLLVESVHAMGCNVPALCEVKVFRRIELPDLSAFLWKDPKYPYIFFFNTMRLNLDWLRMIEHLGYAQNFDPRGKFYTIRDDRIANFGGPEGYVKYLRQNFAG
jgi:hypothetical protein